ncbi:hypothetical protein ACU6U9_08025 [Pseudomonas sp. HK3]
MTPPNKHSHIKLFSLYGSLILLTACGGNSYNSTPLVSELVERSCIDSNNNHRCEIAELEKFSELSKNKTSIDDNTNDKPHFLSTRLLETVNTLTGEQKYVFTAPLSSLQTDALTTLLWHEIHHNPLVNNAQEAKNYLTQKLGIIWPQGNIISAAYEQQESIVREHLIYAQSINTSRIAITATVESMIQSRSLDTMADFSLVQDQQLPLVMNDHYVSSAPITRWHYNQRQQKLAIAHLGRTIELLNVSSIGQMSNPKDLNISSGTKRVDSKKVGKKITMLATRNTSLKRIDAFTSATSVTPAPPPAPPPVPVPPTPTPTNPDAPTGEARVLTPSGEIQALYLSSDNRTGLVLTIDSAQLQSAKRACNQDIISYGIFKFDYYLTNNKRTPVTSACSQHSLSLIDVSSDGSSILAWDYIAKRLYIIDSQTMYEASSYYLQLNSPLLKMKLNPSGEYAFIAEEEGQRSYIVRINDMKVMDDFSFAGNQIEDVQWLAEGNKLFITSLNEWQLWDTRLAYNPTMLESGELIGTGKISLNDNASLIARINNNELSIYRLTDNAPIGTYNNVESIIWNGDQIFTRNNNTVRILSIQPPTSNPVQAAKSLLTDSYIAASNTSLNNITSNLMLPNNVAQLSHSQKESYTEMKINWEIPSELSSNIDENGTVTQSSTIKQGVLTATINGYFRGDALRWQKQFRLTIPAQP